MKGGLHADVLIGKILEGWKQDGGVGPALKLVSMYVEQFTDRDLARSMANKYNVPIFETIEKTVTVVVGDPSAPDFRVPNVCLQDEKQLDVLNARTTLKTNLDRLLRRIHQSGVMEAIDRFDQQALNLLTSHSARTAFDLSREPDAVRDRYGRNQWGQQCLMARRLVEAGVDKGHNQRNNRRASPSHP